MDPEVAVTVRGIGPGATLFPAVITIVWDEPGALLERFVSPRTFCDAAPGVKLKLAGAAVTPVGNPETNTLTELENPFSAVAEIEIVCVEFGVTVTLEGTVIEKLGWGVAAGSLAGLAPPPPQPVKKDARTTPHREHENQEGQDIDPFPSGSAQTLYAATGPW
jgi:hypothetical protein